LPLHSTFGYEVLLEQSILLLESNPNTVLHQNMDGQTPLHQACSCLYDFPLIIYLLLLKVFPDTVKIKYCDGNTAFHLACIFGCSLKYILFLLEHYLQAVHETNQDGQTSLFVVIFSFSNDSLIIIEWMTHVKNHFIMMKE
jgi:ankyrin repeat protein